jgi:hypothetical protein
MYCAKGQASRDVIEDKTCFLPLTDIRIRSIAESVWWSCPFAAVNREQILSWQEETIYNIAFVNPGQMN